MFSLRNKKDISSFRMKKVPYLLLCVDSDVRDSSQIWINTVCCAAFNFGLDPLFSTMDMSKFKDGRVQFIHLGVND